MAILVDGYNLIWAIRGIEGRAGEHFDPADESKRLVDFMGAYAGASGERVVIVFDGDRPPGFARGGLPRGVRVAYSGPDRKADDVIVEMAAGGGPGGPVTVVSSDREIKDRVRAAGAEPVGCEEFRSTALGAIASRARERRRAEPRAKQTGLTPGQAEVWMEILGLDDEGDGDDEGKSR
jgi:predicted RNA-binding protein with PIN domain